ncbi:MAG TPA: PDZ domain-containing protein, partial [Acidobacteriaceae bacterium]|nr:PDZ domain-containing protein [Acidobacteriaceae bacterium]
TGAVGAANMVGKQFDVTNKMLRIPEITWGRIQLKNVGMVSRPAGVYERFVSEDMTAPIVGALSGNVLRRFRLELDYPAGVAYLQPETTVNAADAACVGLIVQVKQDGVIVISGIPKHDGKMELDGIEPGDVLLRVDDHSVTGASLATVLDLLSGRPGERKRITIRRGERDVSVFATVSAYP